MIALIGATGTIGSALVPMLAAEDLEHRVLCRDPARAVPGTEIARADLGDPASLRRGLAGAEQLFLLTPHGPDQLAMETAAIEAAQAAGVNRIVKISGTATAVGPDGPGATAVAHWRSEQLIEASGLAFTFLRPSMLMQNLLDRTAPVVASIGVLPDPFKGARVAMVEATDVAAAAAAALRNHLVEGAIPLTGPRAVSFKEIADELGVPSARIGSRVLALSMRRSGASAWEVAHALALRSFLASGADSVASDGVLQLSGQPPRGVAEFLAEHAAAFGGTHERRRQTAVGRVLSLVPGT